MEHPLRSWLDAIKLPEAEWIGIRHVVETEVDRVVRDERPQVNSRFRSEGLMVEVLARGQFAYASTPRIDILGVREAAQRALAQALSSEGRGVHRFGQAQRPPSRGEYRSQGRIPFDAIGAGEINDRLIRICQALKVSHKIIRTLAVARMVEAEFRTVSTSGGETFQKFQLMSTHFEATAQDKGVTQRRSDFGHNALSRQSGLEQLDLEPALERARLAGEQAIELLSAEECPTATTDLILMPDQMMLQIHESIGHPLEIDRILGDERNYAGVSFVRLEDFGRLQYGSPLMNVTFDPGVAGEFASYGFDDSGMPAQREYLIREGRLLRGLGGLESQARSGVPGVANFRACSWNRAPIDRMANLNLEPGESSLDEMIGSVDDGVLMFSNRSWSIDDYRRKFQFGCEYAQRIKGGKLVGALRNPNYRGVTVPFWTALKKVGRRDAVGTFGTPSCGKGEPNQAIRVGHASPPCLFSGVEVFGGAS